MSYFNQSWGTARKARDAHSKSWKRSQATASDAKWHALSTAARLAYLTQIKATTKEGSFTQPSTALDKVPAKVVEELVAADLIKVDPPVGKKAGRILPHAATYDFSARLRSIYRYHVLGPTNRENLTKYVKHAFHDQGESVINGVLAKAGIDDICRLDEGLENYVTSRSWPEWTLTSISTKPARLVLEALRNAPGPVALADLPSLVKEVKEAEIQEGLSELVAHLAVFEDLHPDTLELVVGLLPVVREKTLAVGKPGVRPPLVVVEKPKEVGPPGGLCVNDLRVFLLEVAGESPRLRQDGGIFQKEEPRFYAAMPDWPSWLDSYLSCSRESRLNAAYRNAQTFGFVEVESDERANVLRLSGKGRTWLSSGLEEQYRRIYEFLRSVPKKSDPYSYSLPTGDSRFLGVPVLVFDSKAGQSPYYYSYQEMKPEYRQALRNAIHRGLAEMPVGVFHRWSSVVDHLVSGEHNPLNSWVNTAKVTIFVNDRPVPRLQERQEEAGKKMLTEMLRLRLLMFDALRPGIDDEGHLCVARLPRFEGYFGGTYDAGEDAEASKTRVIVQPDFSLVVIGLNPSPAAELAPFCERAGGQAGQGVMTFKITRDSVIRADLARAGRLGDRGPAPEACQRRSAGERPPRSPGVGRLGSIGQRPADHGRSLSRP